MTDFAFVTQNSSIGSPGGLFSVGTGYDVEFIELSFPSASAGSVLAELDLQFPEDARIESGHFEIAADPVDPAVITTVATLRPTAPASPGATGACAVDFGRLVTTGGLVATDAIFSISTSVTISRSYRWTGSDWRFVTDGASFAEVATERVLFESDDDTSDSIAAYLQSGREGISLPQTPSGLELLIDGTTVWFERQGSSPITFSGPQASHRVSYSVDRTDAVRDAIARAVAQSGTKKLRVGLRAGSPGALTLIPHIAALRVHTHTFMPDGVQRNFDMVEEGRFDIDVTPPNAADIREVSVAVRGSFAAERVQPAIGPELSDAASLTLAPGRPLLLGLPVESAARFGKLTGVRLHLTAGGTSGCEVSGRLLASVLQRPGDPIPDADLASISLVSGESGWHTLPLPAAIDVPTDAAAQAAHDADPTNVAPPDVAAWMEVQLGYGEAICATTTASPTDANGPGAPVVRRLPGGGTKGLTVINALGPMFAATRMVGVPDRDRPIAAVTVEVPGAADVVGVNPTADPVQTLLTLQQPLPVAGPVLLRCTVTAPGSVVLDTIQVTYRELDS